MREEFHLLWLGYLAYSLANCVIKLCIETDLTRRLPRPNHRCVVLLVSY